MSGIDPARWAEVRRLVGELIELDAEERAARLGDLPTDLADDVRRLVAASEAPRSDRLERAVARGAAEWLAERAAQEEGAATDHGLAGAVLGAWRLERPLGRGGMAEVWEASRADGAYEQRVAVKVLKRGMDSDELVERFRRERQILARLDHPAIARLLDGGVAPDGRLFLVLEKVDGAPITDWCRAQGADLEQRLRLLVEVCRAVSAAHRQLVVHRDLKPSNILVDGAGRPRLLDFGIAKILDAESDDPAGATRTEVRVLTPAYAAPEQIRGLPVSTATDVYALGVLAYELATGRLPHRRSARGLGALESEVASEVVTRPSQALLEEGSPAREASWARTLRGDLDTVLLRALQADPARRYAMVGDFAEDLLAALEGRPIAARRDAAGYRLRRFLGRHRWAVAASTLALVALVAALATALVQARRARDQAVQASRQAARADRVRAYLVEVFSVTDPVRARGETVSARALLDEGLRRIDAELGAEPDLHAEMLDLLADLYRKLGELEVARATAERALALRTELHGADSREAATSERTLGWTLANQGEFAAARPRLEHSIAVLERIEGPDSLAAAEAREPLMELVFAADGPAATLEVVERRLATYRRVLTAPDERLGRSLSDLGVVLGELERFDEAEAAYRESLENLEATVPPEDPRLAYPYGNLAALQLATGRPEEALANAEVAVGIRLRALGPSHPETGQSRGQRVQALLALGRLEEAEAGARELLDGLGGRDRFGETLARATLGQVLLARGRAAEALATFEEVLAARRALMREQHPLVHAARLNRVEALLALGRSRDAAAALDAQLPELEGRPELAAALARARALRAALDA